MHFIFLSLGYHPDLIGGAYRYVTELAVRLVGRGHEVEVIVPNPGNRLAAREVRGGVTLHRYPDQKGGGWMSWRAENRAAQAVLRERLGPETFVVFHHGYFSPCLPGLEARSAYFFYGPWGLEYLFARQAARRSWPRRVLDHLVASRLAAAERRLLRGVRRIFVTSRYVELRLPVWHGSGLAPVEVVFAGVDVDLFSPAKDRAALRRSLGLAERDFLFVTVRRLDPRMGLLTLVDAFGRAATAFPQARLWLAGTGSQKAELEARVRALGLEGRVKLVGFVPEADLPGFLSAADCALMPSLDLEGFGLATVEALACGTPVLGSKAGATPEVLSALGPDLLFETGSVDSLATHLQAVLANPQRLPGRERCRDHVLREFTWDRPVTALERAGNERIG